MKTQVLQTTEDQKRKKNFVNVHNTRRLQWNGYRRYIFTF